METEHDDTFCSLAFVLHACTVPSDESETGELLLAASLQRSHHTLPVLGSFRFDDHPGIHHTHRHVSKAEACEWGSP